VQTRRWTNQSLPQTLQIGVFLLYFEAVMGFIFRQSPDIGLAIIGPNLNHLGTINLLNNLALLIVVAGGAFAGYQISNEKKIGWTLGLVVAAIPLVTRVILPFRIDNYGLLRDPLGLMFDVALMALLLHEQSRNYVRLWFK